MSDGILDAECLGCRNTRQEVAKTMLALTTMVETLDEAEKCFETQETEIERLRAVLRATHERHCTEVWTSRGKHAPECLLFEVEP
jgi:glutamate-1-semialdehyde aminotransferase